MANSDLDSSRYPAITAFPGGKRVFFGHQSVGSNIIDGIQHTIPSSAIFELSADRTVPDGPGFFHSTIGQNCNPVSKIDDFSKLVMPATSYFDIALMKFCYVDINKDSDIQQLFRHYNSVMEGLQDTLPNTQFIHTTVPLRTINLGLRSRLRRLTGQRLDVIDDNIQRESYNKLVRSRYGDNGVVFDLAEIESTRPDGRTSSIRTDGTAIPTLYSGYSDDGGHLNKYGSQLAAARLVEIVSRM